LILIGITLNDVNLASQELQLFSAVVAVTKIINCFSLGDIFRLYNLNIPFPEP